METLELAQNYFGNTREGSLAGPVGAFIVAALAVITVLLIRNMNARLRRLPARFDDGGHADGDDRGHAYGQAHDQGHDQDRGEGHAGPAGQAGDPEVVRTVDTGMDRTSQNG